MSGAAGGGRISRTAVEATVQSYIKKVLSKFPAFKKADISGSYNVGDKSDFGDIDLIVTLDGEDKKKLKQELAAFFASQSDSIIVPFKSAKYAGKKSLSSGELVTVLYPIEGEEDQFIQVDNIIATTEQESGFKKSFLDFPAEIQGLILGLTKVMFLEDDTKSVLKRLGIVDIPKLQKGQEYELNLSSAGLTLRIVTLSGDYKEVDRTDVWKTTSWDVTKELYTGFNINGTFEELLDDIIKKTVNPRSKRRIKGIFKSMVSIKSGEIGTAKGDRKAQSIEKVDSLLERLKGLGRVIAEEIVNEPGICFYPGGFKPPHKGHFEAAKDLASRNYITEVRILIGHKVRDNITPEESLTVWTLYLEADPNPKIKVRLAEARSPIRDIFDYLEAKPELKVLYVAGAKDEVDDQGYFKSLQKAYPEIVKTISIEEKFGRISASYVRELLKAGNYEAFAETIPEAAYNKGYAPKIFKMLAPAVAGDTPVDDTRES